VSRGWWRDNRWWLPALPVSLAALMAASAYNVKTFWYEGGLHDRVASAERGEFVSATERYDDPVGATSRTFRVRLDRLRTVGWYPFEDEPGPPPDGVDAIRAYLDWEARPDQVLAFCTVSLVDEEGRRYDSPGGDASSCVPEDRPGPTDPFSADGERGLVAPGHERPEAWSTAPVFLVPEGRRITRVLVWWRYPHYVELSVS